MSSQAAPPSALDAAHYILCTVVENDACGYWFSLRSKYKYTDHPFRVEPLTGCEFEDSNGPNPHAVVRGPMHTVSAESLLIAARKLVDDEKMPDRWRRKCAELLATPDIVDFDVEAADVLFQYAVLGSIVYG